MEVNLLKNQNQEKFQVMENKKINKYRQSKQLDNRYSNIFLFKKYYRHRLRWESSPEPPEQKACHYNLRQRDSLNSYATIFHLVTEISVQYWSSLLSVRDAWVIIRMLRHSKLPSGLDTNPFRVILLNHIKDFVRICYCNKNNNVQKNFNDFISA